MNEEDYLKIRLEMAQASAECGFWRQRAGQLESEAIQARLVSLRSAEKVAQPAAPSSGDDKASNQ